LDFQEDSALLECKKYIDHHERKKQQKSRKKVISALRVDISKGTGDQPCSVDGVSLHAQLILERVFPTASNDNKTT
jgi:hypothetical protein